jgi:hypothetical protein
LNVSPVQTHAVEFHDVVDHFGADSVQIHFVALEKRKILERLFSLKFPVGIARCDCFFR